ncbi:MAG TPA: YdeI/OmpD-associated family protein, partial [Acidimicrobiales bacterium]|nr:YdeI/OmpD-associated family protein [Acidimicrobiales bacterium]
LVERLQAEGRMRPAGTAQVAAAQADGRWQSAYPGQAAAVVPDDLRAALDAEPAAAAVFAATTAANRYAVVHRVLTARSDATRAARIERCVAMLARGEVHHPE